MAAALAVVWLLAPAMRAQGTKQWSVDRYEDFQRGQPEGVALRNDGRIEAGPAVTEVLSAGGKYVWSVTRDAHGALYTGLGGSTGGEAAVLRLAAGAAKPETIFTGKEMGVQAVRVAPDGTAYAATSPGGKVYRLGSAAGGERVIFDSAATAEKPKYLWDLAVGGDGAVYVAAGAPAVVYRVEPGTAKATVLFRTADQHLRTLLMAQNGVLWAGSDGAGVVYRFDTRTPGAKPFAAYAAGRREITALAMDAAGNLYAAAVGAKGPGGLPPLPVTGSVGITVTFLQPGSATAAGANSVVPDGSEIDRIAADGVPEKLLTLKDEVVYGLAMHGGALLAATGNRGRVYRMDPAVPGRVSEVARLGAGQGTSLVDSADGVMVGTSNAGKVLRLRDAPVHATYTSEVFDAGQYARWGRMEVATDAPGAAMSVRSGNVPNAIEGWSDWVRVDAGGASAGLPAGRYAQWRAELPQGSALDRVTLNYLPRNVAPQVDEVVVASGARVAATTTPGQASVQVVLPSATAAQAISLVQTDASNGPLTAQKDRTALTVRWAAHDDNGDDLMFAVWYRGEGEASWRLLKDTISDRYLSFDASLLPDGRYEAKVVASDAPVHTDAETLTGERQSAWFVVDTTPPAPGVLTAGMEAGKVHWRLEVKDAVSPIAHAEFSLDAGPWQYVEPVGGLSDALTERYDSVIDVAAKGGKVQHVLAVRVYDRAENMVSVKTVVR